MNAGSAWSTEQRRLLAALGVPLMVRVAAPATAPAQGADETITDPAFASLLAALQRAAGGRNLAGMLLDRMGTSGYTILFAICGSAYLVAFVLNHLLAPKFEPIKLRSGH